MLMYLMMNHGQSIRGGRPVRDLGGSNNTYGILFPARI